MDQALSQGADVVGGLDPCSMDRDPKGHLDAVFDLSQKHGKPIDIHLHEPGEMGAFSIELILERTKALGLSGRVVISHAYCLGAADRELTDPLIAAIAGHGVAVMTTAPMEGAPLPLLRLLDAGVVVCSGSDGIRDSWSPYGNGDMLERAMLIGMRNDLARDDEIERVLAVCTTGGARAMRLSGYGLEPGCAADCVLLPGETIADAVVTRPAMRTVIKSGRVVT